MKTIFKSILGLLVFVVSFGNLQAQTSDISGNWSGMIQLPGIQLKTIYKIHEVDGKFEGTFDVPQQGATNLPLGEIKLLGDSVKIKVPVILGTFEGKFFSADSITGKWMQNGQIFDLNLKRTGDFVPVQRPQTPVPPFPYLSEEVEYTNPESGFKLAGTLTFPKGAKNCPAVVLITGSGAQDRDETIYEHKPFLVIADYFARNGIATLRVDDRGVGGSEGNISSATSEDFATDILSGVDYLKSRKEIDPGKIGLVGHSEGGVIAPIAATKSSNIAFIVTMAGPGTVGEELLYEQGELSMRASGMPEYAIKQQKFVQKAIFDVLKTEPDSLKAAEKLQNSLSQGMYNEINEQMKKLVDEKIASVNNNWFRYLLTFDPIPTLEKVKCPVLAINGAKDVQVPVSNLKKIYDAVTSGGNQNIDTVRFENHNHLLQVCETGATSEYSEIEQTIDPQVLETVKNWILKTTSN